MDLSLYQSAMEVVPLLRVALFLDDRAGDDEGMTARARSWQRLQDRVFTVFGLVGFVLSMVVVACSVDESRVTRAVVLVALGGCTGLLFARIWRRFENHGRGRGTGLR